MASKKYHVTTIEELIEKLSKYPSNTKVVIKEDSYNNGYTRASNFLETYQETITKEDLAFDYNPNYFEEGEKVVVII